MWLVYCGLCSGALFAVFFVAWKEVDIDGPGCLYGVGLGMVGGALATAIVGFFIGAFVKFYDVPSHPGLGQGVPWALIGFLVGGMTGVVGGAVGGFLGGFLRRR
jgi:hypothetical protein